MRNLIRFTSKEEYANQFLSGKIYMNTLSFYWSNGFEDQKDFMREFAVLFLYISSISFLKILGMYYVMM